jgi:hypothetical protein
VDFSSELRSPGKPYADLGREAGWSQSGDQSVEQNRSPLPREIDGLLSPRKGIGLHFLRESLLQGDERDFLARIGVESIEDDFAKPVLAQSGGEQLDVSLGERPSVPRPFLGRGAPRELPQAGR